MAKSSLMATNKRKEELKRLMEERRRGGDGQGQEKETRIESPLAKYDSSGGLFCILCNLPVVGEASRSWSSHLVGKVHKERLDQLKRRKQSEASPALKKDAKHSGLRDKGLPQKRKPGPDVSQEPPAKVDKREEISKQSAAETTEEKPKSILKNSFREKETEREEKQREEVKEGPEVAEEEEDVVIQMDVDAAGVDVLPPGFFDNSAATSENKPLRVDPKIGGGKEKAPESDENDKEIPKGFFDNPMEDAKARHVVYKDPMDEEWEKFQKAIATESNFSRNLVEEELEEIQLEKTVEEIEDQMSSWVKIDSLQKKAEERLSNLFKTKEEMEVKHEEEMSEGEEEDEDEDLDMFSNWRSKGTVRRKR